MTAGPTGGNAGGASGRGGREPIAETAFGNADAPGFIHRAMPIYPRWARKAGKEGKVVLRLLIDRTGRLQEVTVIEPGGHGFTESAVEAVRKSSFSPATRNGVNVASRAILPVRFSLK